MPQKKISKALQSALFDLNSGDLKRMDKGIQVISSRGHIGIINELVNLLMKSTDEVLHKRISTLLADIHDEGAPELIISFLTNEEYSKVRKTLLVSVWNSVLDYSPYMADFVCLAVEGDFLEALECLTILENMAGPFEEHELLEAQLYLKEYLAKKAHESEQKNRILSDIALFIKEQNEGVDADLLME